MIRLTRDGTAEPVSRDQILRRERGQGNINFPRSADHVQDWEPYLLVHTLTVYMMCDQTYSNVLRFFPLTAGGSSRSDFFS